MVITFVGSTEISALPISLPCSRADIDQFRSNFV